MICVDEVLFGPSGSLARDSESAVLGRATLVNTEVASGCWPYIRPQGFS